MTRFVCFYSGFRAATAGFPKAYFQQRAATNIGLNDCKGGSRQVSYRCLSEKRSDVQRSNKGRKRRRYEYDNKIRNITLLFTIAMVQYNRDTRDSALATRFAGNNCFFYFHFRPIKRVSTVKGRTTSVGGHDPR